MRVTALLLLFLSATAARAQIEPTIAVEPASNLPGILPSLNLR